MMNNLLKNEALIHGDRLQIIAPHHLKDLKNDINTFARNEELNGFQKWIVNDLYNYRIPDTGFAVRSIILIALPHPFFAEVLLNKNGKEYTVKSLVCSDFDTAERNLKSFLQKHGYHAEPAQNLPLKRLSVQSDFSEYIEGMGSNFSLAAYFSDLPCEDDTWRETIIAKTCAECHICLSNCPTGAIRKERFLIDNQKCLSAINETPGDFPRWLPASVHHTCYDFV